MESISEHGLKDLGSNTNVDIISFAFLIFITFSTYY